MPQITIKIEARLPELKNNKKLYNGFMKEKTIEYFDPESFDEAIEQHGEKESLKAMRTKLKTNVMDEHRNEMIKELRKEFNEKVGDQLGALLGV